MKKLTTIIHSSVQSVDCRIMNRRAARAIVLREDHILLMFTSRHNDYSLPGGGVAKGEDVISALRRELREEVGATEIFVKDYIGYVDEYRPSPWDKYDLMFMRSFCYLVDLKEDFERINLQAAEIKNGVKPVWISLDEAINHNDSLIRAAPPEMGISIQRETWLLKFIKTSVENPK